MHDVKPVAHDEAQSPALHTDVVPVHVFPQVPQFLGSLATSTHAPLHDVRSAAHPHAELAQTWSSAHAFAHAPQSLGLLFRSTHAPLQFVSPGVHVAAHAPALHTGIVPPQVTVHAPQFFGSVRRSTHVSAQRVSPS